jgi:glycosyltransferase involved in cell wall biosynthesis
MKIAVVGPSPVPFVIGGIEYSLNGIYTAINEHTSHSAELIKVPVKEDTFWNLIDGYYRFYKLDLSHFDMVITSKYPAWMVAHKNTVYHVAHRLRGLYDTYHLFNRPLEVERGNPHIDQLVDYMRNMPMPHNLDVFFEMLFVLQSHGDIPQHYFEFPGPLIRSLVHYMDNYGMSKNPASRYYAISKTVAGRREYFPQNADVEVAYLPPSHQEAVCKEYRHIFMISRLDHAKRIDMLIRAMKHVRSNVDLYIAGTGPQEDELKQLAKDDDRIHFLGFVNDDEAERYYADSLVIPYFPYEEDYGLITIEAMIHKKPVITTVDAGGPTEFVSNGVTGYVVKFNEKAIAEKIDYFAENRDKAQEMGQNAYTLVKDITWENAVATLLSSAPQKSPIVASSKKKITVTSTFPIYPPLGGGQARIYNLYKQIAQEYRVEVVSFTNPDQYPFEGEIADNFMEIRTPKSEAHMLKEWDIEKNIGVPITDIAMITLSGETPAYSKRLEESIKSCSFVVISHPFLYYEAKKYMNGLEFAYEAHNVEYKMKQQMLPQNKATKELVDRVFAIEKECCEKSKFILTCSQEDCDTLKELYGVPQSKMIVVPNGVDTSLTKFVSLPERSHLKLMAGLHHENLGLFMGSWHGPNLEACEIIIKIAEKCPDTKFLLMGSQCLYFKGRHLPENVGLLGVVSDEEKNRVFSIVDFAINPMLSGSGTNLKMFDYMAAGIPIITTEFGTRGIEDKSLFVIADTVPEMCNSVTAPYKENAEEMTIKARSYVEKNFDWKVIAEVMKNRLNDI